MSALSRRPDFVPADQDEEIVRLDDALRCSLCKRIFFMPVMMPSPCYHSFCQACLARYVEEKKFVCCVRGSLKDKRKKKGIFQCPSCGTEFSEKSIKPNTDAQLLINDYKVFCINQDRGCNWIGKLVAFHEHLQACSYETILCPMKGCGETVLRNNLVYHLERCGYRKNVRKGGAQGGYFELDSPKPDEIEMRMFESPREQTNLISRFESQ